MSSVNATAISYPPTDIANQMMGNINTQQSLQASLEEQLSSGTRSTAREMRRAFAEERGDSLLAISTAEDSRERTLLVLDPLIQVASCGDLLDLGNRERRLTGQLARPLQGCVE